MLSLQVLRVCVMSAPRAGRISTFVGLEVGTRLVHPLRHRGGLAGLLGVFRDDPSAQTHGIACLSASSDACAAPGVQRARESIPAKVFHPIQTNPVHLSWRGRRTRAAAASRGCTLRDGLRSVPQPRHCEHRVWRCSAQTACRVAQTQRRARGCAAAPAAAAAGSGPPAELQPGQSERTAFPGAPARRA